MTRFLLALLAPLIIAFDTSGQSIVPAAFQPPVTNATSYGTWHVKTSDFNKDGNTDLIIGDHGGSTAHILMGNGSGSFTETTNYPGGSTIPTVWVSDFNKDGNPDFVGAYGSSAGIGLGLGNGTFVYSNYVTGGSHYQLAVGDFDSDGYPDLITPSGNYQAILKNKGDGTFEAPTNIYFGTVIDTVSFPLLRDFDNDNTNDLVLSYDTTSTNIYFHKGLGGGTFAPRVGYRVQMNIRDVAAADFNGDNNLDLVALSEGDPINILLGNGAGGFAISTNNLGTYVFVPSEPAMADFNGDGAIDIAVTYYYNENGIHVFLNDGAGRFTTLVTNKSTDLSHVVAAGDFNNDGRPDIVATGFSPKNYIIHLNVTTPALTIESKADNAELSWPDWAGFYPVSASALIGADWLPVTNAITPFNGRKTVEVPWTDPHRFYRLKKD